MVLCMKLVLLKHQFIVRHLIYTTLTTKTFHSYIHESGCGMQTVGWEIIRIVLTYSRQCVN